MADKHLLFVSGLDEQVTEDLLYDAFIPFGEIKEVQMPLDPGTGKQRGFGFVEYEDIDDAKEAIDNMHNAEYYGRVLKVSYSKPTKVRLGGSKPVWTETNPIPEENQEQPETEEDNKN
ncbi:hypothetical protein WA158_001061 [Blastocystis sp. Blastoise]